MASPNKAVDLPASRIVVPDHVVRREFAAETVVLNLKTGKYHGLNPTAGRMLDELEGARTIAEAAKVLAKEYGLPADEMQDDLVVLCRQMLERELIEVAAPADG
jgi:hypothetical protein